MASKRKKTTPVRGILVFIVIVAISGYALAATNHFDNPFTEISDSVAMGNLVDGQFGADAASLNTTTSDTGTAKPSFDTLLAQDSSSTNTLDTSAISTDDETVTLAADSTFAEKPLDTGNGIAGHDENSIQWSQIGDVLFDLWFLCAATVFVIIMQQIVGFMIRGLKRRNRPAMAA
jgi:hypothetical protein